MENMDSVSVYIDGHKTGESDDRVANASRFKNESLIIAPPHIPTELGDFWVKGYKDGFEGEDPISL